MLKLNSDSTNQTINIGKILGNLLRAGDVVTLTGDLGAGKTHFAKGVALGLGISEHITSPTFTIINEYLGQMPFYHIDAYRLGDPSEVEDLGLEEYLYGEGVTLIEWPQILGDILPKELLQIEILKLAEDENCRVIKVDGIGSRFEELIRELKLSVGFGD